MDVNRGNACASGSRVKRFTDCDRLDRSTQAANAQGPRRTHRPVARRRALRPARRAGLRRHLGAGAGGSAADRISAPTRSRGRCGAAPAGSSASSAAACTTTGTSTSSPSSAASCAATVTRWCWPTPAVTTACRSRSRPTCWITASTVWWCCRSIPTPADWRDVVVRVPTVSVGASLPPPSRRRAVRRRRGNPGDGRPPPRARTRARAGDHARRPHAAGVEAVTVSEAASRWSTRLGWRPQRCRRRAPDPPRSSHSPTRSPAASTPPAGIWACACPPTSASPDSTIIPSRHCSIPR